MTAPAVLHAALDAAHAAIRLEQVPEGTKVHMDQVAVQAVATHLTDVEPGDIIRARATVLVLAQPVQSLEANAHRLAAEPGGGL